MAGFIDSDFETALARRAAEYEEDETRPRTRSGLRLVMKAFDRITKNPGVMGGKACIRAMRVTVGMIVGQLGAGHDIEDILNSHPYLEREDVLQAARYAAVGERVDEG